MLIDHIGIVFFPSIEIFRIIGRVSFPIFCFFIAEGFIHTRSRWKYLLTLLIFAIVSQYPYMLAFGKTILELNVLFTFALSLILLMLIDRFQHRQKQTTGDGSSTLNILFIFAYVILLIVLSLFVKINYSWYGILLPAVFYVFRDKGSIKYTYFAILTILFTLWLLIFTSFRDFTNYTQIFALLCIPLFMMYNGNKGKYNLKYIFYTFYPVHLLSLFLISLIIFK